MRPIKLTLIGLLVLMSVLWVAAEPGFVSASGIFGIRTFAVQYTGVLAMSVMSVAMLLALRPRWPERWLGGLDKMYRLHKWLGITGLVLAIVHWLWTQAPKWAVGYGLLARPERGPRPEITNTLEATLRSLRGTAEGLGEWAFYGAVALIAVALIPAISYWLFYKTHRLIAVAYLVLVFHAVVLLNFADWTTPLGLVMALLLAGGTWSAITVLLRRVGAGRKVTGTIARLTPFPGVKALAIVIDVPTGWPGHKPGQFAFAESSPTEGPHPYTIASAWDPAQRQITFVARELGDHTRRLKEKLSVGQSVTIEGPYGCFTFADDRPQIWVGGGIGVTPFIARMTELAARGTPAPDVHLFLATADVDDDALARLEAMAEAAGVRFHLIVSGRDERLTADRLTALVPHWQETSVWFCGPAAFGAALKTGLAAKGFPVRTRFHQELFQMR